MRRRVFTTKRHEGARSHAACSAFPRRAAKGREALRRRLFTTKMHEGTRSHAACSVFQRRAAKGREALRRRFFTTKGHEGTRSHAACSIFRERPHGFASLSGPLGPFALKFIRMVFAALRGKNIPKFPSRNIPPQGCLSISWLEGLFSVPNHRGEKVPRLFKFYHGTVKILPRYRKSSTAVP